MNKKNVVILGAGFGGLRAAMDIAKELKRMRLLEQYEVTLIDHNDCHIFIPLLYKVAARPEPEHEDYCSYDIAALIKNLPITFVQGEIILPDVTSGMVALKDGRAIHTDYLVIALGSETNYFGIPGLKNHALQLKTIESAKQIRVAVMNVFARGGDVRIIAGGGGPNGIELAAEIRLWANQEEKKNPNLHATVSIVEAMPGILTGFAPHVVGVAMKRLAKLNIPVMTSMKISAVSENNIAIGGGEGQKTINIPFDVFIWTGGAKIPDLLATLPLQKEPHGKPMATNAMSCLPGTPDITLASMVYAAGDNVCFIDPRTQKPVPSIAHVAIMEGAMAAHNLIEEIKKAEIPAYIPKPQNYIPDSFVYAYVIPVGERWAAAKLGPFIFSGWLGWGLGRLIELNYLTMIMPTGRAVKEWLRM